MLQSSAFLNEMFVLLLFLSLIMTLKKPSYFNQFFLFITASLEADVLILLHISFFMTVSFSRRFEKFTVKPYIQQP